MSSSISRRYLGLAVLAGLAVVGFSLQRHAVAATPPPRVTAALPSLAPLVDSVKAAVVKIDVLAHPEAQQGMDMFPFSMPQQQGRMLQKGSGSGFIIQPDGLILTNNHVVQDAEKVQVRLSDGRSFEAKVLGHDKLTDLALIKLRGKVGNLPVVALGDSDAMKVGDWVVAIGNPFGLASSVSAGIISATARDIHAGPYDDFLQTDAAINPGNSGGPLFNLNGEVIGINTAILSSGSGIGFAIPSSTAKVLIPQLQRGEIRRGWLGVSIQDVTPNLAKAMNLPVEHGAVVAFVNDGSPASQAGLKAEDVVVGLDGKAIDSSKALTRGIGFAAPGKPVTLTVYRGGSERQIQVALGERPDLEHVGNPVAPASEPETHETLGLHFRDAPNGQGGAVVTQVDPGSAAEQAEIQPGMLIVQAGHRPVRSGADLFRALKEAPHGGMLLLRVQTEGGSILTTLAVP